MYVVNVQFRVQADDAEDALAAVGDFLSTGQDGTTGQLPELEYYVDDDAALRAGPATPDAHADCEGFGMGDGFWHCRTHNIWDIRW